MPEVGSQSQPLFAARIAGLWVCPTGTLDGPLGHLCACSLVVRKISTPDRSASPNGREGDPAILGDGQGRGRSFTRGRIVTGTYVAARDNGTADVTIRIFGPRGQGKLYEWAQETNRSWQICSLVFRPDNGSQEILIVPDESSHCEHE